MQSVSPQFLASIPTSTLRKKTLTVTVGGITYPLTIESGTWSCTSGQMVRRKADLIVRVPNSSLVQASQDAGISYTWELLGADGAIFDLSSGFEWDATQTELVGVVTGHAAPVKEAQPEGTFSLTINDFGMAFASMSFLTALTQPASMTRVAAAAAIVSSMFPGITIVNTATDTGTLNTTQVWSGKPVDAVRSLLTDAGAEGFFAPGPRNPTTGAVTRQYVIRDLPTVTGSPVWTIETGNGGTVKSYARTRPLDKVYNAVKVVPGTTDGSQSFRYGAAIVTDPADPRYPGNFGMGVRYAPDVTSKTAADKLAADEMALRLYQSKYAGTTETLELGALANPALEAGDVVKVKLAASALSFSQQYTHLLDSFTVDILTDDMTAQTRSTTDDS